MSSIEFTPSFGNRPTHLVGRDDLMDAILAGLETRPGSKGRAVVLLGQRGMGKTVLLWEIADRAREHGIVVASPTTVREGFVERVMERLQEDFEQSGARSELRVSGGGIGALGFSANVQLARDARPPSVEQQLTTLCRRISQQGMGALLLVDELQANTPDMRQLVATYQEMVGEGLDVAMVLAGLPSSVSSVLNDKVLTFLNRARKLEVSELAIGEVDVFYRRALRSEGIQIASTLRRRAAEATQGSPYLMQLIGHYLVEYSDRGQPTDEATLSEALTSARFEFEDDVCSTTLAALSAGDVRYLDGMARLGAPCRSAQVAQEMGETIDYAQQYRRRLMQAGVIEAPRRGCVDFAVPYLQDYLRRGQLR